MTKSNNIVSVWVNLIVENDTRKELVDRWKKIDEEWSKKYVYLDRIVSLHEINCVRRKIINREVVFYDRYGKYIQHYTFDNDEVQWESIGPETMNEALFDTVCKVDKKQVKDE